MWIILEEVYSLRNKSGYTVKEIMNTWLTTKHHPELFIQCNYELRTVSFLSLTASIDNSEWIIPVNYLTEFTYNSYNISNAFWLVWSDMNSTIMTGHDEFYSTVDNFFIVNVEQTGKSTYIFTILFSSFQDESIQGALF